LAERHLTVTFFIEAAEILVFSDAAKIGHGVIGFALSAYNATD